MAFRERLATLSGTAARALAVASLSAIAGAPAAAQVLEAESSAGRIKLERVAAFDHGWGMDFLPDGRLLVTERDGALYLVDPAASADARKTTVAGAPEVYARGQGGLLDVALSPDFSDSGLVYLSYAASASGGAQTAVDRAVLSLGDAPELTERKTIFRQTPAVSGGRHFGSRIVFGRDGMLFVTLGERGQRPMAQALDAHFGKVVRIDPNGFAPGDNPFVGKAQTLPEIWSLGHRNPQGATIRPSDGTLWTVEHGAQGGDEINKPEAGANYGWPEISYGRHYSGGKIGQGVAAPGFEQPIYYWDPSIAPSGLYFYEGDLFAAWSGDLLVGALKFELLVRLDMDGDAVVGEERLFEGVIGRIRDVAAGPDGAIWLLTDEDDGGLWRAAPAK